jgi:predicted Zn-dependent protease
MKRGAVILGLFVLLACEGPFIPSTLVNEVYPYNLDTTPPKIFRWEDGARIRVFTATELPERRQTLEQAVTSGMRVWNDVALYDDYELVSVASVQDADVVVRWSDEVAPIDMADCPPVLSLAVTTFCLSSDTTRLAVFPLLPPNAGPGSVRVVVTILGAIAVTPVEVQRLVAHELGHVLGIGQHSSNALDLMHVPVDTVRPTKRDAATVQTLYRTDPDITP